VEPDVLIGLVFACAWNQASPMGTLGSAEKEMLAFAGLAFGYAAMSFAG
jgi:hypothetical protein